MICWICEEFGRCPYPVCYQGEQHEFRFEQETTTLRDGVSEAEDERRETGLPRDGA